MIQGFLEAGKLNLQKNPTQHGFLCLFTAWLIEDDLPFTIGESLALKRLYEYMDSQMVLPSDTAIHNAVAHIMAELYSVIVKELLVSIASSIFLPLF